MPMFEIEQFELHTSKYRVDANSEAEAIARLFKGEGDLVETSLEIIEVADDYGMTVEDHRELAEELYKLGAFVRDDVICSVRTVRMVT